MTVTDEPGVYIEGQFGIRTENMMLVVESELGAPFLRLEPLTLCPIDTAPIDLSLMTKEETEWLNKYHARVRTELLPLLTDEQDREWLTNATKPI
jgi:Xaa-Pro aminopeptidase